MNENDVILPPLLNRAHKVMISGRVGQPSHRAISLAFNNMLTKVDNDKGKLSRKPKPNTKTPNNQRVE